MVVRDCQRRAGGGTTATSWLTVSRGRPHEAVFASVRFRTPRHALRDDGDPADHHGRCSEIVEGIGPTPAIAALGPDGITSVLFGANALALLQLAQGDERVDAGRPPRGKVDGQKRGRRKDR